jgi:hypothetical protein
VECFFIENKYPILFLIFFIKPIVIGRLVNCI